MVMVIGIWMPIPARKSTKDKDLERAQARRGEGAQSDQDGTFSASRNQAKGVYFSVAGTFSQPMHERCTKFYTDIRSTHLRTQNMENPSSTAPDEPVRSPHASRSGSRPNGNFQQMGTADVCIRWIQLGDLCSKTNSKRCWPWREHEMQWRFLNRKKQMYTQVLQAGRTRTTATVFKIFLTKTK